MSRFLAMMTLRPGQSVSLSPHAPIFANWTRIWDQEEVQLWCEDGAQVVQTHDGTAILGTAFHRESGRRLEYADLPAKIDTQALASKYWGHYVALTWDALSHSLSAFRSPLGALACYTLRKDDAILLASEPRLLFDAAGEQPRVDWEAVGRHFAYAGLRQRSTCLEGVVETEPGTQTTLSSEGEIVRLVWSPWDFVVPRDDPLDILAAELRETVMASIGSWAAICGPIGLTVSGGLDSSIIAGCLKSLGADFAMLTMATDDPDGDERDYARLLAQHLNAPLHERRYALPEIDVGYAADWRLPRPSGAYFLQSIEQHCAALACDQGRSAFFNGSGGDNVFCLMQSATAVTDRYLAEGPHAGLRRTIMDICDLTGATLATVIRRAIEKGMSKKPPFTWRGDRRLLTDEFLSTVDPTATHWWLAPPRPRLPGKAVHIGYILRALSYNDGLSVPGISRTISPLLSQPVVEFCLSIPTWQWVAGGRDRSLARTAFSSLLPPEITNRRSKGGPDSFSAAIFEAWRPMWRELLLEGQLAQSGVIDRSAVERVLRASHIDTVSDHQRLMALAGAEIWGRSWTGGSGVTG